MATAFAAITETQYHFGWNSLAVLADAGHVFADVVGTAIALGAMQLATRPATGRRSFGFYRFEILAAVINALILIAIASYENRPTTSSAMEDRRADDQDQDQDESPPERPRAIDIASILGFRPA